MKSLEIVPAVLARIWMLFVAFGVAAQEGEETNTRQPEVVEGHFDFQTMGSFLSHSKKSSTMLATTTRQTYTTSSLTPPKTPPQRPEREESSNIINDQSYQKLGSTPPRQDFLDKYYESTVQVKAYTTPEHDHDDFDVLQQQEVLLLHGPKQRYAHTRDQAIPGLKNDREMLVKVQVIGLNPIDWKAP